MKLPTHLLSAAALLACASAAHAWEFTVTNSTGTAITGIQATEDGSTWGEFDLDGKIPPGGSMTLVWSPATDDSGCEWDVMATYADGSESEPATFDFCEEDLELEFTE